MLMIDQHQLSYGQILGYKTLIQQLTNHLSHIRAGNLTQQEFKIIIKWPRQETNNQTITLNFTQAQIETQMAQTFKP